MNDDLADYIVIECQHAKDHDIEVRLSPSGISKEHVPVEPRDESTKCHRCYQYGIARPEDYNLCKRCKLVMHIEYNNICVACESKEATDNLCEPCREKRIKEYDAKLIAKAVAA